MKTARLLPLCVVVLMGAPQRPIRAEELPPAAKETLEAYEKELAEVQGKVQEETKKAAEKTVDQLKQLQDKFCKEAKLDEAVAIRDQIRQMQGGAANARVADLPPAAKEVLEALDKETIDIQKRVEERAKKVGAKADAQLKMIQDKFCKEAKLDEAVAVRDLRRLVQHGVTNARPDPGYLHAEADDIGKVWYFEVTGNNQGATWGTDVYTTDSHLAATAVHAGVLRVGQKGYVKVTILPGQNSYPSSTRNGITSQPWGFWGVSFKVERVIGVAKVVPPKE
jgi:hypothetical protein